MADRYHQRGCSVCGVIRPQNVMTSDSKWVTTSKTSGTGSRTSSSRYTTSNRGYSSNSYGTSDRSSSGRSTEKLRHYWYCAECWAKEKTARRLRMVFWVVVAAIVLRIIGGIIWAEGSSSTPAPAPRAAPELVRAEPEPEQQPTQELPPLPQEEPVREQIPMSEPYEPTPDEQRTVEQIY